MHDVDVGGVARFALHIEHLPLDHIFVGGGELAGGAQQVRGPPLDLEQRALRPGREQIAGQHAHRVALRPEVLAHPRRDARAAAAHVVAIHPVVVREKVGLEQLERRAGRDHGAGAAGTAARLVGRREQGRTQPLAPSQDEIPPGGCDRLDGDPAFARLVDASLEPRREPPVHLRARLRDEPTECLDAHRSIRPPATGVLTTLRIGCTYRCLLLGPR